jgi:hypothetical protein
MYLTFIKYFPTAKETCRVFVAKTNQVRLFREIVVAFLGIASNCGKSEDLGYFSFVIYSCCVKG